MTDINELVKWIQELELQLSHALMAADAEARYADEFKAKYEAEKIARQTFEHGHRIASDNCVRLERELKEARKLRDAVDNLIKVKGRHHTEVAYQCLISVADAARQQQGE